MTSQSKKRYTPGPWEIYEGGNFIRIGATGYIEDSHKRGYMGGPLSVCELEYHATDDYDADHALAMANARLIAAAPELLEVLKEILSRNGFNQGEWATARAVIAKAEDK